MSEVPEWPTSSMKNCELPSRVIDRLLPRWWILKLVKKSWTGGQTNGKNISHTKRGRMLSKQSVHRTYNLKSDCKCCFLKLQISISWLDLKLINCLWLIKTRSRLVSYLHTFSFSVRTRICLPRCMKFEQWWRTSMTTSLYSSTSKRTEDTFNVL